MTSPHREQTVEQMVARISSDLFDYDPPQNQNPNYYPQIPHAPPQISHPPPQYFPDLNYYPQNPNIHGDAGATASNSTTPYHISPQTDPTSALPPRFTTAPGTSLPNEPTPDSSVPPSPAEAEGSNRRKRKKPTAPIYDASWWRFYEQTKDGTGKLISARCKVKDCKANYVYVQANGLSTFKKHADKHMAQNVEPQERADNQLVQTLMNSDGTRTHRRYDEKIMLREVVRYIVHKEQPISTGNCLSFARMIKMDCELMYKRFHHKKIIKEIARQYTERKNQLIAQFALATYKVSITSDIWTAGKHGLGYSCITGHYIDQSWNLQKRVLSFRVLESPHTAQIIYQSIINVLEEYNLKRDLANKVFSISFDNASNNLKSIDYFTRSLNPILNGQMFHQKCACHILHLTVKAGLNTPAIDNLIMRFKQGLAHIFSNNVRKQDFAALCSRLGLSRLRVPWDIDTRWNSIYRMLHRCLPYKVAIDETLGRTPEGLNLLLSEGEWIQIDNLKKILESFFNATVKLSCSYTPSAHELLHHLYMISKVYREMEDIETCDSPLEPIVAAMKEKFLKYWEEVPLVTIIANCLHPSFKKKFTVKMLQRYKHNLHLDHTMEEPRVNAALEEMFNLYNSRRNANQPSSSSRNVGYEF